MAGRNDLKLKAVKFSKQVEFGCGAPLCLNYYCKNNPNNIEISKPEVLKIFMELTKNQKPIPLCYAEFSRDSFDTLNKTYSNEENISEESLLLYNTILPNFLITSSLFEKDNQIDYKRIGEISQKINTVR